MKTEITLQTTQEQHNNRLKVLETQKEETEQELQCLYDTLTNIKALKDRTKPNTTAIHELQAFEKRLIQEIEVNQGIKDEYNQSIEFIINQGIKEQERLCELLQRKKSVTLSPLYYVGEQK